MRKNKKLIAIISVVALLVTGSMFTVNADFTNSSSTNSHYNRTEAKNYIEEHVTTPSDDYAWFGSGTDGGDCTNFVSQVLKAGGMAFTSRSNNPTDNHWYYYTSDWGWGRTSSWTGADFFRKHWGQKNGVGNARAYSMKIYTAGELATNNSKWQGLYSSVKAGDVIQFVYYENGETYHSQVVHRTSTEEAYGKVSTAQHSTGSKFNNPNNKYVNLRTYCRGIDPNRWVCVLRIKKN